jgi:hypothetical protein
MTVLVSWNGLPLPPAGSEPLDGTRRQRVVAANDGLARRGFRVIAVALRPGAEGLCCAPAEILESGQILVGLLGLYDPPRPEVPAAIRRCRNACIRVTMVTGDCGLTAQAIAQQILPCARLFGSLPGVIAAEIPKLALRIATGVAPATVVLILDVHRDGGTCSNGMCIVVVDVSHDDVWRLRNWIPGWRVLQTPKLIIAGRTEHDHSVSECELGVGDPAIAVLNNQMGPETEGITQPIDGGFGIPVPQRRDDGGDRVFGDWHDRRCGNELLGVG